MPIDRPTIAAKVTERAVRENLFTENRSFTTVQNEATRFNTSRDSLQTATLTFPDLPKLRLSLRERPVCLTF